MLGAMGMRSGAFVRPGRVEWREVPSPILQGPNEALVCPTVLGRCDLDVGYLRGILPLASGSPIGHEIIGKIVALGEAVRHFHVGQNVFVPAQISCGACVNCGRGLTGRCLSVPFAASYGMGRDGDYGGGMSDLLRVPFARAMLTPVPAGVDPCSLIGAADMATDAWRAIAPHLERHPSARVLVLGGLPAVIGLYSVGLATALGAPVVHYVDNDETRRRVAVEYGAKLLVDEDPDEIYDIVVVANTSRASVERAFRVVAPGGNITSVAPALDGSVMLESPKLYHAGVTWTIGRPDCRHAHDGTLSVWANRGFRADRIPTLRVDWDDAPEAWANDALYVIAVRGEEA
jgi:threonine dehydrogenase-like Zn-dependent dehydrogenase